MGLGAILGGAFGAVGGFLVGGPAGAAAGFSIGAGIGEGIEEEVESSDSAEAADQQIQKLEEEREKARAEEEKIRAETAAATEKSFWVGEARDEALISADRSVRFLERMIETRNDRALEAERVKLGIVDESNDETSSDFEFVAGLLEQETKEDAEDSRESLDQISDLFNT